MIVDRADEIAYMSHDIDDGIHAGLISFDTLKQSALIQEILHSVEAEGIRIEEGDEMFRYRFSSHFINHLVYSLLDFSKNSVEPGNVLSATIPSSKPLPIGFDAKVERDIKKLKKILHRELYQHKNIVRKMFSGKQAIIGLYRALQDEPKLLPKYFYRQLASRHQHRVIADYIASMSDRYAIKLHNELYGRVF